MKHLLPLSCLLAFSVTTVSATDLDEVLEKNYEARGGLDKIMAVETARMSGIMTMGPMQAPFQIAFKRPNKVRLSFEVQGITGIQAYDGQTGWSVMPFMGRTDPEKMSDDELKSVEEMADLDGPLVNWKEKGYTVRYQGTEEIEGTEAHVIEVERGDGESDTLYLDSEYYLTFKSEGTRTMMGNEVTMVSSLGDYKEFDGLIFPTSMMNSAQGMPEGSGQNITIESIEFNVDLDDSLFEMPEVAEEAEQASEDAEG